MYHQNYDPLGNAFLSTVVAAIPILVLLYFIALHRHRDAQGNVHFGISAPYAAFFGVIAAFLVSCLVFKMPFASAISAFALGSLSGFLGIIWIVLGAMFLYTMTVVSGKFEIVKESIVHISFDRRLQCVLIAFSFGAIIEGTSGFGTPVAIAGAVMVGLGFAPFQSAVLNLLANTAPVAWGAIGTPIVTLAAVSGLDQLTLSTMAGRQLPFVSVLVPFWLVATFVRMEGGTWKEVFEVWPAAACAGISFAVVQWFASSTNEFHLMTDVVSGVFSVICTALFLRFVWHPKSRFLLRSERNALAKAGKSTATATADSTEWKILVHHERDDVRLGALGDIDTLLRALGHAGVQKVSEQPVLQRNVLDHAARRSVFRHVIAAGVGHAGIAQSRAAHAAGGSGQRQAGGRTLHHQLAFCRRNGCVRRRDTVGFCPAVERRAVEGSVQSDDAPHEDSGPRHRPGARTWLPHALRRNRCGARPRIHRRGLHVSRSSPPTSDGWACFSPAPTPPPMPCSAACSA